MVAKGRRRVREKKVVGLNRLYRICRVPGVTNILTTYIWIASYTRTPGYHSAPRLHSGYSIAVGPRSMVDLY